MAYLLDANVFIQAKNLHYGFDFCPAFWDWLDQANASGLIFSIDQVGDELAAGADDLATWAAARRENVFLSPDAPVFTSLATVSTWATTQGYDPSAVSTFFQVADYWLVAYALAHGHTVVTHEVPAASARRIKIPNVCVALGIECINPYQMLRRERARFVLGPT